MDGARFVFCPAGGQITLQGRSLIIPESRLLVVLDEVQVVGQHSYIDFYASDLQFFKNEIALDHLLDLSTIRSFKMEPIRQIELDRAVMQIALSLANISRPLLLRFIYIYCLLHDRQYFSNLLERLTVGAPQFYAFIEKNSLQPWSVAEFAQHFDMPIRKFNLMFQEKFGSSAKSWLLNQRLNHAKNLLQSTPKKVLEVALECGFNNHAHFTNTFRKHFKLTPKACRRQSIYEKYLPSRENRWT